MTSNTTVYVCLLAFKRRSNTGITLVVSGTINIHEKTMDVLTLLLIDFIEREKWMKIISGLWRKLKMWDLI